MLQMLQMLLSEQNATSWKSEKARRQDFSGVGDLLRCQAPNLIYDYQDLLRKYGIRQSMGAKGDCYDNACSESFFATIKKELVLRRRFKTRSWARLEVIDHILWYNSERIHSYLDDMSPLEFEQQYYRTTSPTAV